MGVFLTLYFSTNYSDLISIRIAVGSGFAFLVAQLIDVNIFDKLRNKIWFAAPLVSSLIGSTIDTFLFFSIAFYETGINYYNVDSNYLKTRHAEVDVLQKLKPIKIKKKLKKINLLVYRTNKKGNNLMMAKPCINCLNYYKQNIKKLLGQRTLYFEVPQTKNKIYLSSPNFCQQDLLKLFPSL